MVGLVDAQEMSNTLRALGLELGSTQHFEVIHAYGTENQGKNNRRGFTHLMEHRMQVTFLSCVTDLDQTSSAEDVITKDHLFRIAQEVPAEELDGEVSEAVVNKTMKILHVGDSKDDMIGLYELQRLILMKPDEKTVQINDQSLSRAGTRQKTLARTDTL